MYSKTEIEQRIKHNLKNPTSKIEGTFSMDNVQAVSQELAEIHSVVIEPLMDRMLWDTASGLDLDDLGKDFNHSRNPAKSAEGKLLFKGVPKVFIPEGTMARVDSLLFITTDPGRLDSTGECLITACCTTDGPAGNVPANVITSMVKRIEGVREVNNPQPFGGGVDREDDASYRARGFEKKRRPITSGNEAYYEVLAKEVSGIGKAKCRGCAFGPGTALLVLLSTEGGTPDTVTLANVKAYIDPCKMIGADIRYFGALPLEVTITGRLVLAAGYIIEEVIPAINAEFDKYFSTIAFDRVTEYISYNKAIQMIFSVPGVQDISEMLLNGGTENLPIEFSQFCHLQEVNFRAD